MKRPDIKRLIELQQLLLKFNSIERVIIFPKDHNRRENDSEHSYSLAMAAWFLAQYFVNINADKVIRLALVHDLVEVHAGDTFVYGNDEDLRTQAKREAAAVKKLGEQWRDFPQMLVSINEYEARETEEAKFVYALDKLMPALVNYLGRGYAWQKFGVDFNKFLAEKNAKIPLSPEINDYYQQFLKIMQDHQDFFWAG